VTDGGVMRGEIVQIVGGPGLAPPEWDNCLAVVEAVREDVIDVAVTVPGHPGQASGQIMRRRLPAGAVARTGGRPGAA
jgi:hypothetical protein